MKANSMSLSYTISRRTLLALAAASVARPAGKKIPIGVELYSVRDELKQDLMGTVRAVAKLGYEGVEFYSPYYEWAPAYAKDVKKLMDEIGIVCYSTHNDRKSFKPESIDKAIELNRIIGSKFIVMASAGKVETLDGWKTVAEELTRGAEKMKPHGLRAGFHNHHVEFKPLEGKRPIEVLAANTGTDIALQLDVGSCIEAGSDPVAWIRANPGRIKSLHLKEWSPEPGKGYRALMGEGAGNWKEIFKAAESVGGVEYYLIEQEGSGYTPMETIERSLAAYKKLHI
ncbi:MAG: sugar phosphate isomerase/epimerase family protein [Bryobacteraceae bacterium]